MFEASMTTSSTTITGKHPEKRVMRWRLSRGFRARLRRCLFQREDAGLRDLLVSAALAARSAGPVSP